MKYVRLFGKALLVSALACVTITASAGPRKKTGQAKGRKAAATPAKVSSLASKLEGLTWGMTHKEVSKKFVKPGGTFDKMYDPILAKLQPGVQMRAVEAERDRNKRAFSSSWIKFGSTPLGYDTTGLAGEYSYKNNESVQVFTHDGDRRFFFYMGAPPNDRLWKIYDEYKLGRKKGRYGATIEDVINKLTADLGTAGKAMPEDPEAGQPLPYVAWQGPKTQLRVVDRSGEKIVGIVVEDRHVLSSLPQLRHNKMADPTAIDPAIARVTGKKMSSEHSDDDDTADKKKPKKK